VAQPTHPKTSGCPREKVIRKSSFNIHPANFMCKCVHIVGSVEIYVYSPIHRIIAAAKAANAMTPNVALLCDAAPVKGETGEDGAGASTQLGEAAADEAGETGFVGCEATSDQVGLAGETGLVVVSSTGLGASDHVGWATSTGFVVLSMAASDQVG
jgi:hypothetical protein